MKQSYTGLQPHLLLLCVLSFCFLRYILSFIQKTGFLNFPNCFLMMFLSVRRTLILNHFQQGKKAGETDSKEYFIYRFYFVESIGKIQYCD